MLFLSLKIYPHKRDYFPRPAVILSDRAQVFLQAALRVFNEESYDQFLSRAYRIVTNRARRDDFTKTNIHACLAHFMLVSVNQSQCCCDGFDRTKLSLDHV